MSGDSLILEMAKRNFKDWLESAREVRRQEFFHVREGLPAHQEGGFETGFAARTVIFRVFCRTMRQCRRLFGVFLAFSS